MKGCIELHIFCQYAIQTQNFTCTYVRSSVNFELAYRDIYYNVLYVSRLGDEKCLKTAEMRIFWKIEKDIFTASKDSLTGVKDFYTVHKRRYYSCVIL